MKGGIVLINQVIEQNLKELNFNYSFQAIEEENAVQFKVNSKIDYSVRLIVDILDTKISITKHHKQSLYTSYCRLEDFPFYIKLLANEKLEQGLKIE